MDLENIERDMKELLNIFNTRTSEGPVYVSTCCQQLWFKHSVFNVDEIYFKTENEKASFITCRTKFVSKMVKSGYAKLAEIQSRMEKFPNCQSRIKWVFPPLPPELQLYSIEERLIVLRIVFMLLRDHPVGGQTFVRGNFVNVPVDSSNS